MARVGVWASSAIGRSPEGRIERELETMPGSMLGTLICDWSRAEQPGIGPVWSLLTRLSALGAGESPAAGLHVRHEGGPPATVGLLQKLRLDRSAAHPAPAHAMPVTRPRSASWADGRCWRGSKQARPSASSGRIAAVVGERFSRPRALRMPSIVRHIHEAGVTAIPIVSLIAFLISVVVSYLGAQQLRKFGADISSSIW